MPDFDRGFKEVARRAGRELARLAGVPCDRWEPLVSEVQTTERFADRAFRARQGRERFVVYFEAYTRWDRHAPWNLMTKAALLFERERLPTQTVAFVLLPRGYRPLGRSFELAVGGEVTQALAVRQVPLWEQVPQAWWDETPALLPLYPLCRHGRAPREAITHAAGVIRERVTVRSEQADALFLLSIFGSLAHRRLDVGALLGREIMLESRIGREMRQLGRVEGERAFVLRVLEERFGAAAVAGVREVVQALEDEAALEDLLLQAVRCADVGEFRRSLPVP